MTEKTDKAVTFKLPREVVKLVSVLAKQGDRTVAAQMRRLLASHPEVVALRDAQPEVA